MYRRLRSVVLIVTLLFLSFAVVSCGGSSEGDGGNGGNGGGGGGGDFVTLSIDGGTEDTYTEAHDSAIECDPRVDWASSQIILYNNYLGSSDWEFVFDIMLINDEVGTYDVATPADGVNVVYILDELTQYYANFSLSNSSGTITITRADSRIEGTFDVVVVDSDDGNPISLSGSFGVDSGNTLSCS